MTKTSTHFNFEEFYDRYAPAFYGEIKRALCDDEISAGILQAAFIKLYGMRTSYNPAKETLFVWAYKIVSKEISRTKIEMVLDRILYSERYRQVA